MINEYKCKKNIFNIQINYHKTVHFYFIPYIYIKTIL